MERANKPCQLCGVSQQERICARCKERLPKRRSSNSRGYNYRWQQDRLIYLRMNPYCLDCKAEGRVRLASELHHIVKCHDSDGQIIDDLMWDFENNIMPLCISCHSRRTMRGE